MWNYDWYILIQKKEKEKEKKKEKKRKKKKEKKRKEKKKEMWIKKLIKNKKEKKENVERKKGTNSIFIQLVFSRFLKTLITNGPELNNTFWSLMKIIMLLRKITLNEREKWN